jgi:transcriptional regulator of heat shock response
MFLDDRKRRILHAIVDYYLDSAEPIASKIIANEYGLDLSSATIRNEMAEMEEMGLIEKPHTSSGRVPSDVGYRYYVDDIMDVDNVDEEEVIKLLNHLKKNDKDILQTISMALSGATHYTTISLDDDTMFLYGRNNVFDYPEFNDVESLRKFMYLMEEEERIREIVDSYTNTDITIRIGEENNFDEVKDYSVVTFNYKDEGTIAIIGPKRMDYEHVMKTLKTLMNELDEIFHKEE